ncbi:hypothetical protein LJB99_04040, partial [Deltaproteobacteria bacterium OttesenSCG-928-K17]|nr:hypothetical protein [Deltaproteobacteria bacterium OttesenSCG-928-K17]
MLYLIHSLGCVVIEYQRYSGDISSIEAGPGRSVALGGLTLPSLARLLTRLVCARPQTVLVAVPTPVMAEDLVGDLNFFWPEGRGRIHLFPSLEAKPFLAQSSSPDSLAQRQWALDRLLADDSPRLVVASAAAALRQVPLPASLPPRRRLIQTGSEIDLDDLKRFLVENGYTAVGQVESRGDFSARGDIVDVYPAGQALPVRIELFGDLVESIRSFRVQDQRSVERLESLVVPPVLEFVYSPEAGALAADKLEALALDNGWHGLLWEPVAERLRLAETFS